MKDNHKRLIFFGIVCTVSYFCLLLIIKTALNILGINNPAISYLIPIAAILVILTLLNIGYCISLSAFSYCYITTGICCGHGINTFFICIIYKIIANWYSFSTKYGLLFAFGTPFIFSVYGVINALVIQVDKITLTYPDFQSKRKICHLSDLHLGSLYQKGLVQKVVNKVIEINPDVVVITGDMADGTENVKTEWLKSFESLSMPILFITGNHEVLMGTSLMLKRISETSIKHIGLCSSPVQAGGLFFLGVDYEDNLRQRSNELPQNNNTNIPTILLNHVPSLKPEDLKEYNIFLLLCGHTHGGQVFPFQPLAWLCNKCFNGLYSTKDYKHHVYVSSGIGNSVIPMRIFSTPVIGLITIQGQSS